ncbi:hypothetical protein [Coleofasciculus sp. E2-BRE-01]|uniref:hypothetical protein n=1 Tax=Coleofasciculus sp. E2-BRE-01 TaxID=3069524 RepID=UPI00330047CB
MQFDWQTFTYDEEWLREAVRLEAEADCDISAGFDWGANLGAVMANPENYSQLVRLRSIVLQAFKELLADWNLGVGADAALVCGRELLMERLLHPTPNVQEQLLAVLEEDLTTSPGDSQTLRAGLPEVLRDILTPEDWERIAVTAGNYVREQVVERVQRVKTA